MVFIFRNTHGFACFIITVPEFFNEDKISKEANISL